jgi:hypothetical protein
VIAAVGSKRWFVDGGKCRGLRGTISVDAKEYEKCLLEAVSKAGKNATT